MQARNRGWRMLLLAALIAAIPGCRLSRPLESPAPIEDAQPGADDEVALTCVRQGIEGLVLFWEGDFMPPGFGTITPVEREMFIHEPTHLSEVTPVGGITFYSEIRTKLVARVWSNCDGRFRVLLPPGTYSVFAKEGALFYANGFAGDGLIYPVTVTRNRITNFRFDITYLATF